MSVPPFAGMGAPPLPPGWAQHIAPTGHVYYHNPATNESTYTRPVPSFANMPRDQPSAAKKKKEKPLVKTPVPGTEWIRVKTTEGNTFYSNKARNTSVWTVPEDIQDAVDALEREEEEARAQDELAKAEAVKRRAEEEMTMEVERIKNEVQDMVGKRKAETVPTEEATTSKKARVDDEDEEDEESEEEEEWQREAAAQLAAEAEEEKTRQEEKKKLEKEEAQRAEEELKTKQRQLNMPDRVDLSLDEAKALFKTLLREKDINPLHPWDTSLPLFVSDPRYVLLPSVAARRDAFDEYCRDRARELRGKTVKEQKEAANPKDAFERLLREEVKSTRTSWTDWRRTWKKDRRFYGWGRDDREREKRFRDYLKELGEKKRAEAQKAEANFFALLKERDNAKPGALWKDVKRDISRDPRYDAVGSSSLREELYNTFLKANGATPSVAITVLEPPTERKPEELAEEDEEERERKRKEKKERAVKERESQVRAERSRLEADIGRSRMGLDKEEGENRFRTMLTDAIRDPQMTWDAAVVQLEKDPRFTQSPLPRNQQVHLFHSHITQMRDKHLKNLHALFESHAPSLATPFSDLPLPSLLSALPAVKLELEAQQLGDEYAKWQRERTTEARKAFDEMLGENAFVEFWGRLGKIGGEGVNGGVKADDNDDEEEGEGGGGRADMKVLAKSIDLREMEKVLKNDKRYIMFEHVPQAREQWLRDYLGQLSAPKLSVHLPPS